MPVFAAGFELIPAEKRNPIADFELKDISGKKVRLSDYRGQAVVVSFWATWCEPCKQELGFLSKYHKELRDKGFEVIAVATDAPETQSQVKSLARQKGWEFKVVLDTAGEVSALLNPRGATPYSLFLDRNGNLSYDHEGYTVGDEVHYKPLIETLLGESAGLAAQGEASGGALRITNTFSTLYNNDNGDDDDYNDDYFTTKNILHLSGNAGNFSTWARVDSIKFFDRPDKNPKGPDADGENPYNKHLELERLNFRYDNGDLELIAGDFYLQLGRGIALSIRKGDEVSAETVLRGGKVILRAESYQLGAFGGTVWNSNTDPVDSKTLGELADAFGGSFIEYSGIEGVSLGAYGYHHDMAVPLILGDNDWAQVGGAYVDLPGLSEAVALYAEVDMQRRYQAEIFNNGLGAFLAGNISLGSTNVLIEAMYLDNFQVDAKYPGTGLPFPSPLNRPPTLSRIRDEVISMSDYYGAQSRFEHSLKDLGLSLHVTGRYRSNLNAGPSPVTEYHGFGGFEYLFDEGKSKLSLDGGYRVDQQNMDGTLVPIRSLTHFYFSYIQSLGESYSLNFTSDTEYKGYDDLNADDLVQYWYGSTFLGINKSGLGALTFELGYDMKRDDTRSLFYAGILKWNMTQDAELRATAGSQRGGLKCVNGVCRIYPAFSGGKVEIIARF